MPALRRRYHELHLLAQDPVLLAGLLVVGAFMLTFVVWPLGRVIVQGFFTAEGQFSLEQFHRYIDPRYTHYYRRIFYDTVRMGLLSASFGTALGLLFAYTTCTVVSRARRWCTSWRSYRQSRRRSQSPWQRSCCLAVTAW